MRVKVKHVHGMFGNGMAYSRFGVGAKTVVVVPGGPGNALPTGLMESMTVRMFKPFLEEDFSVWFVTRRLDMPRGYTIEDMATDYARLIEEEFGGEIDLYLGISFGGAIGLYLAANHPECFRHIVLVGIGYEVSEEGKRLDYTFAKKLSEGKTSAAGVLIADDLLARTWLRRFHWLSRLIGPPIGFLKMGRGKHKYYRQDVLTEAEAEVSFDARDVLHRIEVPVLLIAGDQDDYFPREVLEETARRIPDSWLRLYEGKGHEGAIMDRRLAHDALRLVNGTLISEHQS